MKLTNILIVLYSALIYVNSEKCDNLWSGKSKKFPDKMIETILDKHNEIRSKVAQGQIQNSFGTLPTAADMTQLLWSQKLARKAQLWANECKDEPSGDQFRALGGQYVGENRYLKTHGGEINPELVDWHGAIDSWFKESEVFDPKRVHPFESEKKTKNFSQIIWARTQFVGCGYAAFKNKTGSTVQYYVCHYSPGGNIIIKSVYYDGKLCSKCSEGYSCSSAYAGLCCRDKYCTKGSLELKSRLR